MCSEKQIKLSNQQAQCLDKLTQINNKDSHPLAQ